MQAAASTAYKISAGYENGCRNGTAVDKRSFKIYAVSNVIF